MKNKQELINQLEELIRLMDELESEMMYNIVSDSPHKAYKNKTWIDQLKEQEVDLRNELAKFNTFSLN
jgi:hypothetical protein